MSKIKLLGSTSGEVNIDVPAVAGTNTLTLPASTGTLLTTTGDGSGLTSLPRQVTLATAQASTSGTEIDFTSIPSGTNRITVMFSGVSVSGTSSPLIQLGTSGGIATSGYSGLCSQVGAGLSVETSSTAGMIINGALATYLYTGCAVFNRMDSTEWSGTLNMISTVGSIVFVSATAVTLAGEADRLRVTTVNGTDTFDAGTINISYE